MANYGGILKSAIYINNRNSHVHGVTIQLKIKSNRRETF